VTRDAQPAVVLSACRVTVDRATLEAIRRHARREAPRECCGLLVGRGRRIDEAVPTRNVAAGNSRYRVDPRDHFSLLRRLRGGGQAIVGAYHSHPRGPATASPTDISEAFDETFLYLIVSLADDGAPATAVYVMTAGRAEPVALAVRD
jgi:proteasome lid subunit RPN8/RPN11